MFAKLAYRTRSGRPRGPASVAVCSAVLAAVPLASCGWDGGKEVEGEFVLLYGLSDAVLGQDGPTCDSDGADVKINDGDGNTVALADVREVLPTKVKRGPAFTTWSCVFSYTATIEGDSPVYTFQASLSGLPDYGTYEKTLSSEEVEAGHGPFLMLSFAPGVS